MLKGKYCRNNTLKTILLFLGIGFAFFYSQCIDMRWEIIWCGFFLDYIFIGPFMVSNFYALVFWVVILTTRNLQLRIQWKLIKYRGRFQKSLVHVSHFLDTNWEHFVVCSFIHWIIIHLNFNMVALFLLYIWIHIHYISYPHVTSA